VTGDGANPYETRRYRDEYLLFHYGTPSDVAPFGIVPNDALKFHERVVSVCVKPHLTGKAGRGLDIGCAVGRQAFELARYCREVTALDRSVSFIRAANRMKKTGNAIVRVLEEGDRCRSIKVHVPGKLPRQRVTFREGDAQSLRETVEGVFDVVLAVNLICRLPRPRAFLRQLPGLIASGGLLVLGGPFSWMTEYTARDEWIRSGDLSKWLGGSFTRLDRLDVPFAIREHRRKYQLVVSDLSIFRRV
jgi:putative 4-mercaptohistidine N1-methyltranferase